MVLIYLAKELKKDDFIGDAGEEGDLSSPFINHVRAKGRTCAPMPATSAPTS